MRPGQLDASAREPRTMHAAGSAALPRRCDLAERLPGLREECAALWLGTPAALPPLGAEVSRYRQWSNARAAAHLIDHVAARIQVYPERAPERRAWQQALRQRLQDFGEVRLGWPAGYRRLILGEAFHEAAVAFAHQARAFDPALSLADLGQALRNVWIANSLQMLTARPVTLTPGLFAYSMLYPATDNVLDAPDMALAAKRGFNDRLAARLWGRAAAPQGPAEARVWALADVLDAEFARGQHPGVWASVLAIQEAQSASVRQQQEGRLSDTELLDLTIAKGGASVLADLYVTGGGADAAMDRLAFAYGVFLQMLDDLQDVTQDLAAGHQTLFARAAAEGCLDSLLERLVRFVDVVFERYASGCSGAQADCIDLIRRNCRTLIVGVIAREPQRFSRSLRRRVERQWPVTLRAMRRLLRQAHDRIEDSGEWLGRRSGAASPLELLFE
jgi:hypothetical protein